MSFFLPILLEINYILVYYTNIVKAKLLYQHKAEIQYRYLVELILHQVGKSKHYPDGLKYSLICFDKKTESRVLMDNHHPKGHHVHIDNSQLSYSFTNSDKLFEDFKRIVLENMGVKL